MMKDPISEREYEETIDGFKRWAANELPHGVPLLYAIVGFVTISVFLYTGLFLATLLFGLNPPGWANIMILFLGLFWAFGGWQHGIEAENDLDLSDDPMLKQP